MNENYILNLNEKITFINNLIENNKYNITKLEKIKFKNFNHYLVIFKQKICWELYNEYINDNNMNKQNLNTNYDKDYETLKLKVNITINNKIFNNNYFKIIKIIHELKNIKNTWDYNRKQDIITI